MTNLIFVNSGEEPFRCLECEVNFANVKDIEVHIKDSGKHANDDLGSLVFVCDQCGYSCGKISVNRSWKIPQSDHFYINQENGFCQDFVDCNGFFGLRVQLQVNKSVTILIQSRQSCCNSVQSSIVKCQYNPAQSIPIPVQFIGLYVDIWPLYVM